MSGSRKIKGDSTFEKGKDTLPEVYYFIEVLLHLVFCPAAWCGCAEYVGGKILCLKTQFLRRSLQPLSGYLPADLIFAGICLVMGIMAIFLPQPDATALRVILVLPVILFIPGYCVIAALFPKDGDIDLIERFVLSFGVSIAVVPLIGLGLNFTPWGIRLEPLVISITLFTFLMILVARYTRAMVPYEERFRISFFRVEKGVSQGFSPKKTGRPDKILNAVLILAILVAIVTAVYVLSVPREGEQFTEFFILGDNRTAVDYPNRIIPGQNYSVFVGVGNYEYREAHYTIETWMLQTEFDNMTNSFRIVAMDPQDRVLLTMGHNQSTIIPYNLSVNNTRYNRMEFLLFDDIVPGFEVTGSDRINASYRNLHLRFIAEEAQEPDQESDKIRQ